MNIHIKNAIEILGGQSKLAESCNVSQPAVHKWLHGGHIAPKSAVAIERATAGEVKRVDLLPEIFGDAA